MTNFNIISVAVWDISEAILLRKSQFSWQVSSLIPHRFLIPSSRDGDTMAGASVSMVSHEATLRMGARCLGGCGSHFIVIMHL